MRQQQRPQRSGNISTHFPLPEHQAHSGFAAALQNPSYLALYAKALALKHKPIPDGLLRELTPDLIEAVDKEKRSYEKKLRSK